MVRCGYTFRGAPDAPQGRRGVPGIPAARAALPPPAADRGTPMTDGTFLPWWAFLTAANTPFPIGEITRGCPLAAKKKRGPPFGRPSTSVIPAEASVIDPLRVGPGGARQRNHQVGAPHHLVVLLVDDVAVPEVAVPAVRVERKEGGGRRRVRRQIRRRLPHGDPAHLAGVRDHDVLPARLPGKRRSGRAPQV